MRTQEAMAAKSGGQVVNLSSVLRAPEGDGGARVGDGRKTQDHTGPERDVSGG